MTLHLRGVVLPDGDTRDVFVSDGKITFAPVEGARTVLDGGYMIPGLFDSHAHLQLNSPAPEGASMEEQIRASAEAQLAAGVLALREPGGLTYDSKGIGPHMGLPRTLTAGHLLAPPGRYVPGLGLDTTDDELPATAETEARASGAWAKVVGDFPAPSGYVEAHYTPRSLAAAADRVHALGARIAIHAQLPDVIQAAIDAGYDTIEHGTFMEPDQLSALTKSGTAWVPTLIIGEPMQGMFDGLGVAAEERERIRACLERLPETVRRASEAGVTVLAGTDAAMLPHGVVRIEMANLLRAGLTPERALGAASWDARRFFGFPCIEEGAPADIVAYADDPRGDPEVLRKPVLRILDGRELGG